jgi:hypothetical protein
MAADFKVGDRVRTMTALLTGCQPGDTGTVEAVIPLGIGGAFYFIKMDRPCRAGMIICYAHAIGPANPA